MWKASARFYGFDIYIFLLSWTILISTRASKVERRHRYTSRFEITNAVTHGFLWINIYPLRVEQLEGSIQDINILNETGWSPQTRCKISTPHGCCSMRFDSLRVFAINIPSPLSYYGSRFQIIENFIGPIPYHLVSII